MYISKEERFVRSVCGKVAVLQVQNCDLNYCSLYLVICYNKN